MSYRDALDLIDLGDWLADYTEIRSGGDDEIRLKDCPNCLNDKFKLYVNTEKNVWICYVCEWGRGLKDFTRLMAAVSGRNRFDVCVELDKITIPAPKSSEFDQALTAAFDGGTTAKTQEQPQTSIDLPGHPSFGGLTTRRVLHYAYQRGLTDKDVAQYQLRAASSLNFQRRTGAVVKISGPFLVFPVYVGGQSVSWQGRKIVKSDIPYVSASNVKDWLFPLNAEFFARYTDRTVVLVEGVFDAIGFLRAGVPALCTFGKSMSDSQLNILKDLYPDKVMFAWDSDAYKEMARAVERVSHTFPKTAVVDFSIGVDGKVDAGDSLQKPELIPWLKERLDAAMDVRSTEFFQWRMTKV